MGCRPRTSNGPVQHERRSLARCAASPLRGMQGVTTMPSRGYGTTGSEAAMRRPGGMCSRNRLMEQWEGLFNALGAESRNILSVSP